MAKSQENDKSTADIRKANANAAFAGNLAFSRSTPNLPGEESHESDGLSRRTAEQLLREVDEFLAEHEVRSEKELQFLIAKIDTALEIYNNPDGRRMREDLIRKFGDDAKK